MKWDRKYAFVGMGNHSINNLYPIISYLNVDLKYIVTKSESSASLINQNYKNIVGTNDIDMVLKDDEVSGIFISAHPTSHYNLVKKALQAGKNVFVEKPPCLSTDELNTLIEIEEQSNAFCMVGLQKQYASCNLDLKHRLKGECFYNYRFVTGAYPEGDPFFDIFIHPISLINFLFGSIVEQNILIQRNDSYITVFLQLTHENKTTGSVELSTGYSWQNPRENMIINTQKGIYEMTNTESLLFEPKAGTIFSIPKEKIISAKHRQISITQRNSFNPILNNNQLYSSGYFGEIKNFIELCEGKSGINNSSLSSCKQTFRTITDIKSSINVQ
ncbi:MAG: Gfo/Idh/MocA family protein [Bacteroidales bacterium]